jgi:hypothetical protein
LRRNNQASRCQAVSLRSGTLARMDASDPSSIERLETDMKKIRTTLLAAAMILGSAITLAADGKATKPAAEQATIPFLSLKQSIREWQADGDNGIWIQDARKQWFYAELQGPCPGLSFAMAVGFEAKTSNTLDRFGSVIVPREGRCQIHSFVKSEAPPDQKKNRKADAADTAQ